MASYFEYLRQMVLAFVEDIGQFLFKAFISPWTDLPENFKNYNNY